MKTIPFTVDSALLQELGERLVGKPYIALAELVKNGYDADANNVTIELVLSEDRIVVDDNGQGMTFEEFEKFWMRIGSTHKRGELSRRLKRRLTGSKGVGRLAVQYLARNLTLYTTSEFDLSTQIKAWITWDDAVKAGDLVDAKVNYEIITSNSEFNKGTNIILSGLNQEWDKKEIQELARQLWQLEPPFKSKFSTDDEKEFNIKFISPEEKIVSVFENQLRAILRIWYAKIVGRNDNGKVNFTLQFSGEEQINHAFLLSELPETRTCELENGEFEIRIYHLRQRQPHGIKVGDAREYLNNFGGVYVYDVGFQLPYYGDKTNDWLKLERDHSHRITRSPLLPKSIQEDIKDAMTFLPTTSRTLGVVNVNTATEPTLDIVITRDRLQQNDAYENLQNAIRYTIDFYALHEKLRNIKLGELETDIEKPKYKKINDVIEHYKSKIDEEIYKELNKDLKQVSKEIETEAEEIAKRVSIVGSLSTVGVTSLAYQHENKRQFRNIENLLNDLKDIINKVEKPEIKSSLIKLQRGLNIWFEDMKTTNNLFSFIGDSENITEKKRFPVKAMIEDVIRQVKSLTGNVTIDIKQIEYMLLPRASLAEWSSIFQNVFLNSFNALLDSEKKLIQVSTRKQERVNEILIQDTGSGVDLKDSVALFKPFVRKIKISKERQALGYGGTGLGLTIVQLISHNIGCEVSFIPPEKGFNTAFSIKWSEKK